MPIARSRDRRWPRRNTVKVIEVLGPGCNNCKRVEAAAHEAVAMTGIEAEIVHVTDYADIAAKGVMNTPGVIIDGRIMSTGRVPSAKDIAGWLLA
jgi:small redox-active disulfide protein 2